MCTGIFTCLFGTISAFSSYAAGPELPAIEQIEVTSRLTSGTTAEVALSNLTIDRTQLAKAPEGQLDEALRSVPGFGLFRRSSAAIANPTSQGVSLRNLGPNGAGRTLVLFDGVPLNDPFGGWVPFSRLPTAMIEQVRLTPGGGAGIWGNSAIAGTMRLISRRDQGLRADASMGRFGVAEGVVHAGMEQGASYFALDGQRFNRGNYRVVDSSQRGAVDVPAGVEGQSGQALLVNDLGPVTSAIKLGGFDENRANGTPLSTNRTRASDLSLRLFSTQVLGLENAEAVVYGQRSVFSNQFTSVDVARKIETPALNQFSVPAKAVGGSVSATYVANANWGSVIGMDARQVRGYTNELFQYVSGSFQRLRKAGGMENFQGAFLEPYWQLSDYLTLSFGARADYWEISKGQRLESNLTGTTFFRSDSYPTRSGTLPNGRVGVNWHAETELVLRAAGYTGFRVPTLNELFRPFRVGGDIIEANPNLNVEHLSGAEMGFDWGRSESGTLSMTIFQAQIKNAVDNVQLTDRPGTYVPLNIVVPAGGTLAQRLNLDQVTAKGVEARAHKSIGTWLDIDLFYLWSLPRVDRASISPALAGRRLSQTARNQGGIQTGARITEDLSAQISLKYQSQSFEDGLNTRQLAPNTVMDLKLERKFGQRLSGYLAIQNLNDTKIETGLRADGLLSTGAPRQWSVGISAQY